MGRTLVGGRSLVAGVGGLGQLGFGAGQTIGQLGYLAGELENDTVLLLHVALQEGQTFFEVMKPGIHGSKMGNKAPGARLGEYYGISPTAYPGRADWRLYAYRLTVECLYVLTPGRIRGDVPLDAAAST